jgi:hypothetical protein
VGSSLPGWWPASRFITGRQASPAGVLACRLGYLVTYQNSGVVSYWVRFSNALGSLAEMFVFQA